VKSPVNRWPAELPGLRAAAEAYTAHMLRVALAINELLAMALGLSRDYFTSRAERATWTRNAGCYLSPKSIGRVADGQLRNGPQTDLGTSGQEEGL
jgi:validamycin A dioxygenase